MRREIKGLMIYTSIFGTLAIVSLIAIQQEMILIKTGMPNIITNSLLLILSLAGLGKTIWHLHSIGNF